MIGYSILGELAKCNWSNASKAPRERTFQYGPIKSAALKAIADGDEYSTTAIAAMIGTTCDNARHSLYILMEEGKVRRKPLQQGRLRFSMWSLVQ